MTAEISASYSFAQNALPPLESGAMALTVTQTITINGAAETYHTAPSFTVYGPRFQLDPALTDSLFPPQGAQGDFGEVLPHVVLTEPTLPWQRLAWADPPGAPTNQAPWLALLLFDEGDPAPEIQTLTLAALAPTDTIYFPTLDLDGEATTDPVSVIDVPIALFNAIAPSFADLGWLAHTRTPPGGAAAYSIVFANRFPVAGRQSIVHLVSLEGYGPVLPPDADRGTNLPNAASLQAVRLVTLANWKFISLDAAQTFAGVAQALDASTAGMQLPANVTTGSGDAAVQAAFGLGYTAMNHALRDGTPTVSWYRGPLLPVAVPPFALPSATQADDLLRYDPTTGLFDTSYAAAWQLGQLMAVRDSAFSAALYRRKLAEAQVSANRAAARRLDDVVARAAGASTPAEPWDGARRVGILLHGLVRPAAEALVARPARDRRGDARRGRLRLGRDEVRAALADPNGDAGQSADLDTILNWVNGLAGLAGVPLNYLVPDGGMLPVESLRVFQVDTTWMAALLAGALGVGGPPSAALLSAVAAGLAQANLAGPMSGFLLRSSIVRTWPGTAANAYAADGQLLTQLQLVPLSSSLLLGLFAGTLARVDLLQPAQTLHFGANVAGGAVQVDLRYGSGTASVAAGSATGGSVTVSVRGTAWQPPSGAAVAATTGNGTLQLDDFASSIASSIWPAGVGGATLTAAEFGLQFVQTSEAVSFEAASTGAGA